MVRITMVIIRIMFVSIVFVSGLCLSGTIGIWAILPVGIVLWFGLFTINHMFAQLMMRRAQRLRDMARLADMSGDTDRASKLRDRSFDAWTAASDNDPDVSGTSWSGW